jgi:hypothetical protein
MYFERWHADAATGKQPLGLMAGLYDVATRWVVTHDITHWCDEIAWMSLYFSIAVWSSLALCGFALVRDRLPQFTRRRQAARRAGRPVAPAAIRPSA